MGENDLQGSKQVATSAFIPRNGALEIRDPENLVASGEQASKGAPEQLNEDVEDEEMTEAEREEAIYDLENQEMDDEMMNNDDLLGEDLEDEQEQIEAISQLSPPNTVQSKKSAWPLPLWTLEKKQKEQSQQDQGTKKRVPVSPESKGLRASRKLQALRSRTSPKGGKGNVLRSSIRTKQLPRNEVFPSALSKKSSNAAGSVVSQKPPSKKI
ncbi:unnamed protein product [Microthlaspi erraticum]|uniref:Uncharacterized protein n=1 Tax=Microthlaspi erraticum TaxID=1685480 RepID=A0A6D2LHP0_9BRAS|nr:unnamed protein product [Microthlaspi erraticum]